MRIFVLSSSIEEIRRAADSGLVDGVAIPATGLGASAASVRDQVANLAEQIVRTFAVPVCVPVAAVTSADIYQEGRDLAKLSDQIIVQIPLVEDAIAPFKLLCAEGVRVSVQYVYNGAQAFLAAKAGAAMVGVPADDLEAQGGRTAHAVGEIRDVLDASDLECDLAVLAPRDATHFTECLLAGADTICVAPGVLQSLLLHTLTDRAVDRFMRELSRRPATLPAGDSA